MADASPETDRPLDGSPPPITPPKPPTERLVSLDALRGFTMFWIIGGDALFHALVRRRNWPEWALQAWDDFRSRVPLGGWSVGETVNTQLQHAPWEGFRFYDLIFPMFLFTAGVAVPFSLGKLREKGVPTRALYGRVFRRGLFLFLIALVYNKILQLEWLDVTWPSATTPFRVEIIPDAIRWAGVLQRIAVGSAAAGFLYLLLPTRGRIAALVAILLGYWAVLAFAHAPAPGDDPTLSAVSPKTVSRVERRKADDPAAAAIPRAYSEDGSIAGYVDRRVLSAGGVLKGRILPGYYGYGDNEGVVSTLPAVATALLGLLAGQWLRCGASPWRTFGGLVGAGVGCLTVGGVWGWGLSAWYPPLGFPVVKNLWTSSFVLWAGGWSLLLLGLFYLVIDVWRLRSWAFPFVVIGMNSITIYVAQAVVPFDTVAAYFVGRLTPAPTTGLVKLAGAFGGILSPFFTLLCKWLFLLFLYRRKIFLRV